MKVGPGKRETASSTCCVSWWSLVLRAVPDALEECCVICLYLSYLSRIRNPSWLRVKTSKEAEHIQYNTVQQKRLKTTKLLQPQSIQHWCRHQCTMLRLFIHEELFIQGISDGLVQDFIDLLHAPPAKTKFQEDANIPWQNFTHCINFHSGQNSSIWVIKTFKLYMACGIAFFRWCIIITCFPLCPGEHQACQTFTEFHSRKKRLWHAPKKGTCLYSATRGAATSANKSGAPMSNKLVGSACR